MAISIVGSVKSTVANATDPVLTTPAGTQVGDVMIIACVTRASILPASPTGTGWTRVLASSQFSGSIGAIGGSNEQFAVWARKLDSVPASVTVDRADNGTDGARTLMLVLRGATSLPTAISQVYGNDATGVVGTTGSFLLALFGSSLDTTGDYSAAPTGMTQLHNWMDSEGGNDTRLYAAYEVLAADGATGTKTVTQSGMSGYNFAALLMWPEYAVVDVQGRAPSGEDVYAGAYFDDGSIRPALFGGEVVFAPRVSQPAILPWPGIASEEQVFSPAVAVRDYLVVEQLGEGGEWFRVMFVAVMNDDGDWVVADVRTMDESGFVPAL